MIEIEKDRLDWFWGVLASTVIVLIVLFVIIQPYFEAKHFNRMTNGVRATYWDAFWTKLRVEGRSNHGARPRL